MKTTVTTETDLVSGQQTFGFELNPVPINSPVGLAPGNVRIIASKAGALVGFELVLKPSHVAFRGALERLAAQAEWPVPVEALKRLSPNEKPVVHLKLKPEALAQILESVRTSEDITRVMNHPSVQDPQNYRIDTITAEA